MYKYDPLGLTLGMILLRVWLALRAILTGVEKYAASTQSLRDVLKKRTLRFEVPDASDVNVFDTWIDNIIDQFTKNGLLNDQLFAQDFVVYIVWHSH